MKFADVHFKTLQFCKLHDIALIIKCGFINYSFIKHSFINSYIFLEPKRVRAFDELTLHCHVRRVCHKLPTKYKLFLRIYLDFFHFLGDRFYSRASKSQDHNETGYL